MRPKKGGGLRPLVGDAWPDEIEVNVGIAGPERRLKGRVVATTAGFLGLLMLGVLAYSLWTGNEERVDEIWDYSRYAAVSILAWALGRWST